MSINKKVPLSRLAAELTALTGKPSPPYRKLWSLAADGVIPTELINGRHNVVVAIAAEKLGMLEPEAI